MYFMMLLFPYFISSTERPNELYSEVRKLFSQISTDIPAAILSRQGKGTPKEKLTKTSAQLIWPHSIFRRQQLDVACVVNSVNQEECC